MDYLWSPWRYRYLKSGGAPSEDCVFCRIAAASDDESNLVLTRDDRTFSVLNLYPYTSGHAMVIPLEHHATLEETPLETVEEVMRWTRKLEAAIRNVYRPDGVNIGMNIGKAAGAGVAGHIHMHILPRWSADSNFITTIGETRVLPEELPETRRRLCEALGRD